MSRSGQAFVAATRGTNHTLYAACKAMGIKLSKEQEETQAYLERNYPPEVPIPPTEPGQPQNEP